jgi:DNA-binding response OmpR family regulator
VTKESILLIEDYTDVKNTLVRDLQRHGFDVTAFDDPKQALSQFKPNYYNIILLDVKTPGMTGFGVAKKIWALEPDAKICFFSAFEIYEREAKLMFKDLKSVRFIKKPILPNDLARFIAENSMQR